MNIGKIPYLNCAPFFAALPRDGDDFFEATPRELDALMAGGDLDAGPLPTAAWLAGKDRYETLGWGIASDGPSGSVLLFSRLPIEKLSGQVVRLSGHSVTSVALLKHLCDDMDVHPVWSRQETEKEEAARLLIGDRAMRERSARLAAGWRVYDLSELWKASTGLPFVFAVWAVRKGSPAEWRTRLEVRLERSVELTMSEIQAVARLESSVRGLPAGEIEAYLKAFRFRLTPECRSSMEKFEEIATRHALV